MQAVLGGSGWHMHIVKTDAQAVLGGSDWHIVKPDAQADLTIRDCLI